jgi:hypothetical protein
VCGEALYMSDDCLMDRWLRGCSICNICYESSLQCCLCEISNSNLNAKASLYCDVGVYV